jgi:maltose/moltooligosaccharide transporter
VSETKTYTVGTLRYTAFGLVIVCFWLLWGDFVFTLLDTKIPEIMPLKLKDLGASDLTIGLLNKTLGYSITFVFAPMISFSSDRHRGRFGRRIPYLAWSTPFVGLFMVLIGCYGNIVQALMGNAQHGSILGVNLGRGALTVIVFGVLFVGFDFANTFVGTVYYYLFNDVVPVRFLSRFLSLFRMVGIAAGMVFSKWVLPNTLDHFRLFFIIGGVAYVAGFMLMCLRVREGEYPPPPLNIDRRTGLISSIKTYCKECFTHRFYWYFFLTSTCMFVSWQSTVFQRIRNRDALGLTLQQIGDMEFCIAPVSFLLQYPAGWLADKYHPIRVYMFAALVCVVSNMAQCIFVFRDFGPSRNLVVLYGITLLFIPFNNVRDAAEIPMFMRLLPKERYGQFCSANVMVRSLAMIVGSIGAGLFLDFLKVHFHMDDWRYRYYPVWTAFFQALAMVFIILMYREWKARGGWKGYTPPEV